VFARWRAETITEKRQLTATSSDVRESQEHQLAVDQQYVRICREWGDALPALLELPLPCIKISRATSVPAMIVSPHPESRRAALNIVIASDGKNSQPVHS
jgi:hypothetical protein